MYFASVSYLFSKSYCFLTKEYFSEGETMFLIFVKASLFLLRIYEFYGQARF